jgi:hypothetical protein
MQTTTNSLTVQDVLSVFSDIDRSGKLPAAQILVELLTADGLLILKFPTLMAMELMESLSRASEERELRE